MIRFTLITFALFLLNICNGQVGVNADLSDFVYNQDFNSLANSSGDHTWTNNGTLLGWTIAREKSPSTYSVYRANDGSSKSYRLYSYGNDGSTDRALGLLSRESDVGDVAIVVHFENKGESTINQVSIDLSAEQWSTTTCDYFRRVTLGYSIATAFDPPNELSSLISGTFEQLPESYLVSSDSVEESSWSNINSLDGNLPINKANSSITFPVELAKDQDIIIRFFVEEKDACTEPPIAIDDLSITFSTNTSDEIVRGSSSYNMFQYLEQGIVMDIPESGTYLEMDEDLGHVTDWENILEKFYDKDYVLANTLAQAYDYQYVLYTDNATNDKYHMLRKKSTGNYFWGTYITHENAVNDCIAIQAPHPIEDTMTGNQAVSVFVESGAENLMIAGISRCATTEKTGCTGETSICGSSEKYRKSDLAHTTNNVFQIATEKLEEKKSRVVVIQLHGFGQEALDPDFIISNGSKVDNNLGVADHAKNIADQLEILSWDTKVVHSDGYEEKLTGYNNVQGRLLNNYPHDICESVIKPISANGKFVHLEQLYGYRVTQSYYTEIASIIKNYVDCSVILPVTFLSFHVQKRNGVVKLIWTTTQEINHSHYEIERSLNGKDFYKVIEVESSVESSNGVNYYEYCDDRPHTGVNYYRLRQVDIDGDFTYLETKMLLWEAPTKLKFYPNPVSSKLIIEGNHNPKLLTLSGQILPISYSFNGNQTVINVEEMEEGLYLLKFNNRQERIRVKRN